MTPFRVSLQPGVPVCEQVAFAARKAIVSGTLRAGDPFPSVRSLSQSLKINPNTAHKIVNQLMAEGLLEVRPGIGTVVVRPARAAASERTALLRRDMESLVVEARRLGITLDELRSALDSEWRKLFKEAP